MRTGSQLKAIHRLSVKDMRRNQWLWLSIVLSVGVCLAMILWGTDISEKKRWMVYAVFLYMAGFSLPLLYYLRYSDRNKKIIQVMIHTRTCHISLYHRLFGIYQALLLTLAYTVVFIVLMLTHTVDRPDLYRLVSMPCCLLILNEFCMLCMKVIRRYAFAVLVYLLGVMFLFTTNQIGIGLFFPIHMENHCFSYFFGKIVELLILFAAHGSWDFLFGKRMK